MNRQQRRQQQSRMRKAQAAKTDWMLYIFDGDTFLEKTKGVEANQLYYRAVQQWWAETPEDAVMICAGCGGVGFRKDQQPTGAFIFIHDHQQVASLSAVCVQCREETYSPDAIIERVVRATFPDKGDFNLRAATIN